MTSELPVLVPSNLAPTRNYLQDVAKVLGKFQQAFLPPEPHGWQYGLGVVEAGLSTAPLMVGINQMQPVLDSKAGCLRFGESAWNFDAYSPTELLANVRVWLTGHNVIDQLEQPEFGSDQAVFDVAQAASYQAALWWLSGQFEQIKATQLEGLSSPILLYPHHFDLSLGWFPLNDDKQLSLGFSTGDEVITEPYVYLTAYPEPASFKDITLPESAYWQAEGFSGAILPYSALQANQKPVQLFQQFAAAMTVARPLLG